VLPEIARLAVARSHGSLIRASAAEFAGQLIAKIIGAGAAGPPGGAGGAGGAGPAVIAPAVINALIGAAADPEPMVRIAAVRSLAGVNDPRVVAALAAHLSDDVRLVRVGAAEGLMAHGIVEIPGARGEALARAQNEWEESLRTFNDVAADHTTLGWLDAARGRIDSAVRELRVAIALDPADARPHIYLGVVAARQGRYDEALRHFNAAKALAPDNPNVKRLIEEASRRATKGH
jgi:hypothetical protein